VFPFGSIVLTHFPFTGGGQRGPRGQRHRAVRSVSGLVGTGSPL